MPAVRILLVTQMWPTAATPELGSFLVPMVRELRAQGHEVDVAAIGRRGGSPLKYARLAGRAVAAARRRRPDVVFAHFLFPAGAAGLAAARAADAPLVVMAHGQDVANCDRRAIRAVTAPVVRGAAAVIANSRWLAARLAAHFPGVEPEVCDLGVDLAEFDPGTVAPAPWPGDHPRFLCVGALIARKNVVALADAFAALGRGSLTYVGDGPLRAELEGRPGVMLTGRVAHDAVPAWLAACDVLCQPSAIEPFGLAALEAMAMERTVVATTQGGPPEFVTPEAGVLVDPADPAALVAGLARAAAMPAPNPAARAAAGAHGSARQAARMAAVLARAVGR
ncbi:glycosyltransferase family 4 protein [Baekduia soli]|uniref:Glycosyltransferase family 4 protein n=1 Tax=Baekduia soli TaxID=496014 RepID=A0A5B8U3W6_9ACTN|nr:glycosyltransferase [Baekduia soli]QEC47717.1 glycosyltransferase family 4 protein [Baekduia soli]